MSDAARAEAERRWPQLEWTVQEPILLESTARVAFVAGAEWQASRPRQSRCESRLAINTEDGPGSTRCSLYVGHFGRHLDHMNGLDWEVRA